MDPHQLALAPYGFEFNPYLLMPLATIFIGLFLIYKIAKQGIQARANRWLIYYAVGIILAGIPDVLSTASTNAFGATIWYTWYNVAKVFLFPLILCFALLQTHRGNKLLDKLWMVGLLFLPSMVMAYLFFSTDLLLIRDYTQTGLYHMMWWVKQGPLYQPVFLPWLHVYLAISVFLFLHTRAHIQDKKHRRQLLLFAAAIIIQVIFNVLTLVVLVDLTSIPFIPENTFTTFIVFAFFAYGVLKYNIFAINPSTTASNIVSTMSEVLVVINPQGNIEFINEATTRLLGYTEADLIGKNLKELLHEEWQSFQDSLLSPLIHDKQSGARFGFESFLYKKNHERVPVNFSASAVRRPDGQIDGIVCIAADVTNIRELHEVTKERNKLDAIMESVSDGIIAIDEQGKIVQINRAATILAEKTKELVVDKKLEEAVQLHEGTTQVTAQNVLALLKNKKDTDSRIELKLTTTNGTERFVQLAVTSLQSDQDENMEAIVTLHDKTEERELEKMKLDFVSMAAHELRTPLTTVRGYLSVLEDSPDLKLTDEQRKYLNGSMIGANQLAALIQNLLNVSHIEQGKFVIEKMPLNLPDLVTNVLDTLKQEALLHKIDVSLEPMTEQVPPILGDQLRISEVITNLVSNAINYNNPGGWIKIKIMKEANNVVVSISDNGYGIPAASLPHLFSKFYRVATPLEMGSKGSGLGLYFSKSIIDSHHGKIWVESEEGKGSTFSFSLPSSPDAVDKPSA